jgi:hypothetical protein
MGTEVKTKETDERYTPGYLLEKFRELLGEIDLDPCASEDDRHRVCNNSFTALNNGLETDWRGLQLYINPPGSQIRKFAKKFLVEVTEPSVFLIFNWDHSTSYLQNFIEREDVNVWLLKGRHKFVDPSGRLVDVGRCHGFVTYGVDTCRVAKVFGDLLLGEVF